MQDFSAENCTFDAAIKFKGWRVELVLFDILPPVLAVVVAAADSLATGFEEEEELMATT